jgi:hypothetical protein
VPSGKRLDVHIPKDRAGLILCFRNIERAMKKTNIILSTIAILSLILFSACSMTEEPPFKVGDTIQFFGGGLLTLGYTVEVLEIKGKWFRAQDPKNSLTARWYNSATVDYFIIQK